MPPDLPAYDPAAPLHEAARSEHRAILAQLRSESELRVVQFQELAEESRRLQAVAVAARARRARERETRRPARR